MSGPTNGGRAQGYQALRESEELHRATIESISDAVFLTDDEGRFTFICPNVDVIFGWIPDEVEAMGTISRLLGDNLFVPAVLRARGEIRNIEREITAKSGESRVVLVHLKAVDIQGGTVLYCCRDVTDLRHAEEELRAARLDLAHAARLALVGELMASIAHEMSQPVTSILANARTGLLTMDEGPSAPGIAALRDVLVDIHEEGRLAADVIGRLRALAGKRPLEQQALDVSEVTGDTLRLVGADARRRGVTLRTEFGLSLPAITADRVCLQQVVLNLLLNAMDAMDHVEAGQRQLLVRTGWRNDTVEVAISDSGPGIPADRLPKLFDAFFTTKKDGLGLGLAIARSIVEAHGGRIWAEDHGGRGATFRVALPATERT